MGITCMFCLIPRLPSFNPYFANPKKTTITGLRAQLRAGSSHSLQTRGRGGGGYHGDIMCQEVICASIHRGTYQCVDSTVEKERMAIFTQDNMCLNYAQVA